MIYIIFPQMYDRVSSKVIKKIKLFGHFALAAKRHQRETRTKWRISERSNDMLSSPWNSTTTRIFRRRHIPEMKIFITQIDGDDLNLTWNMSTFSEFMLLKADHGCRLRSWLWKQNLQSFYRLFTGSNLVENDNRFKMGTASKKRNAFFFLTPQKTTRKKYLKNKKWVKIAKF